MTEHFSEKSFYLSAFHGTTLAFSLSQETDWEGEALCRFIECLVELSQQGCRTLLFIQKCTAGQQAYRALSPLFIHQYPPSTPPYEHGFGQPVILPYPLWQEGSPVVPIPIKTEETDLFLHEVVRLAIAWRVKRLVMTQRGGGVASLDTGRTLPYVNIHKLTGLVASLNGESREKEDSILYAVQNLLNHGVEAVSLCRLADVPRELFTYEGCGTFFSKEYYCQVRALEIDDFTQVATLIRQGESEGYLLPRSDRELSEILLSGYGAFLSSNRVAGVCCLIRDPYQESQAGEIVTLYALTRFQGEGIGVQLIRYAVREARRLGLRYLFSCTTREQVVDFFERNGFSQVDKSQLPEKKWCGYDRKRKERLVCLRLVLTE
ncbi:MAG: GNAT family N-acetyltransferase [Magnetococcales bacterium]|nr:GNAT family N-acetyltransferase [Magnetococcales bacterium]